MAYRRAVITLLLTCLCAPLAAARPHFVPPDEGITDQKGIDAFKALLAQKSYGEAAAMLDPLLVDDGDKLMAADDGALISVSAWLQSLPADQRAGLAAAYRDKFEPAARAKLDALRASPTSPAESFVALARQYPFSAASSAARVAAADRFLELSDIAAASALYQMAIHDGWSPDEAQAAQVDLLRHLSAGDILSPADKNPRPIPSTGGPIPFDAPWFNSITRDSQPRFFPVAADDRIFLSSAHWVVALKQNGQVTWATQSTLPVVNNPPRKATGARPEANARPPYHAPGILTDIYGHAQVLIARQVSTQANEHAHEFCLRAYRATDGKLLWTSENQPYLKDVSFASAPAVCGRYTYAVAMNIPVGNEIGGDQNLGLFLIALDTLTGDFRWQTTLGRFTLTVQERGPWGALRPWDEVWEQSEPLVSGDAVYVTPSAGFAAAVGRFHGNLRWHHPYPSTQGDAPPVPGSPPLTQRWRGTPALCDSVLVIAPQDTPAMHGLDAATGQLLWSKPDSDFPTLIGQTPTAAILAGKGVASIDPKSGKANWRWEPARGEMVTGPAVVRGSVVRVPTQGQIVTAVRADDGTVMKATHAPFNFRALLNADAVKKVLNDLGAAGSFGLPESGMK